jgi:hypothetical protein
MPRKSTKTAASALPPPAAKLASKPIPDEIADLGRETVASALNSSAAFNAGVEAIGQEVTSYARASFENAGATARALLGARTFEDVVRLQTDFAKRNLDDLITQTAKLSELGCSMLTASLGSWSKVAPR